MIFLITLQMTMFVTKLNGNPVGITVGKFYVADKNAVLTVRHLQF